MSEFVLNFERLFRPAPVVRQARHPEAPFGHMGASGPTNQRHQHDGHRVLPPALPEGVFLVPDAPTALSGLEGVAAQRRRLGRVSVGFFFAQPPRARCQSVSSISAGACFQAAARCSKAKLKVSCLARSPAASNRKRNAQGMRASGTQWRWARCANLHQATWAGSMAHTKFRDWIGVGTAGRGTRGNCAAPKVRCGSCCGRTFQCSLMKSPGIGSRVGSNCVVPFSGSCAFVAAKTTPLDWLRLRESCR